MDRWRKKTFCGLLGIGQAIAAVGISAEPMAAYEPQGGKVPYAFADGVVGVAGERHQFLCSHAGDAAHVSKDVFFEFVKRIPMGKSHLLGDALCAVGLANIDVVVQYEFD